MIFRRKKQQAPAALISHHIETLLKEVEDENVRKSLENIKESLLFKPDIFNIFSLEKGKTIFPNKKKEKYYITYEEREGTLGERFRSIKVGEFSIPYHDRSVYFLVREGKKLKIYQTHSSHGEVEVVGVHEVGEVEDEKDLWFVPGIIHNKKYIHTSPSHKPKVK